MSGTTTGQAIEKRDASPAAMVKEYEDSFIAVLPSHIPGQTWIRLAQGVLRRDRTLAATAKKNPASLMVALLECARLGHEPGTESFYLVPIGGSVEGWEGYRGVVERIYRAGAVDSIKCDVVRDKDTFVWRPESLDDHRPPRWEGPQRVPYHDVDWFGERGEIVGAYSYAIMNNGSVSKVVVLNKSYLAQVRAESRGSDKATSPWVKWTESMVLKTAAHRLEPWVPTSSEYRAQVLGSAVAAEAAAAALPAPTEDLPVEEFPDDDEPIEAEIVEDDDPERPFD